MSNSFFKNFFSQPHQPFFTSGIIFFILYMILLLTNYLDVYVLDSSIIHFHAYPMVFAVFSQFFLGFLYTVFPRYLNYKPYDVKTYQSSFFLYFVAAILILVSLIANISIIYGVVILLIAQIQAFKNLFEVHKNSQLGNKTDTKWILIFFSTSILAQVLFLASFFIGNLSFAFEKLSINIGFYLFLFGVIISVSQRMIPFFTRSLHFDYQINKSKNFLELLFFFLVLKVVLITIANPSLYLLSDLPLFIITARELIKYKLPFKKSPAILWVLFLALYWIPVSFAFASIESLSAILSLNIVFEKVSLHILALGYFVTVLLGFGTRVTLGHSGQRPHANNFTIFIFIFVQVIVFLRILSAFSLNFSDLYISLLNITSLALIIGLITWSSKYLKILIFGK